MSTNCITYYLEMNAPGQLREKPLPGGLSIVECETPQPQLNRFLYDLVGEGWNWNDLKSWTTAQWQALVEQDCHRTWVAYMRGAIAGYYELYRPDGVNTEIRYFGLAPQFIGQRFGGALLSRAIRSAWEWTGTQRVWVHTCTLDHPSALGNYKARGFEVYKEAVG